MGREIHLSVTVSLCIGCHRWLTGLQYDAGIFRHGLGGDGQRLWSIFHGFTALLIAHAHAAGVERFVHEGERHQRAMLRLLAAVFDQPLGPNPIANTVRSSNRKAAHVAAHGSVEQWIESLTTGIVPALADMLCELLAADVELLAGFTVDDAARLLPLPRRSAACRRPGSARSRPTHPRAGRGRRARGRPSVSRSPSG
ncbi:MAG: hypothetical protein JO342_15065 [Solirubrobacterales bacterium]|nr:hypothetical protein [Solirubrobacterales bacterium]